MIIITIIIIVIIIIITSHIRRFPRTFITHGDFSLPRHDSSTANEWSLAPFRYGGKQALE